MSLTARLGRLLFSFRGRVPRSAFWGVLILAAAGFAILLVVLERAFGPDASLGLYPPLAWIAAALAVKRVHDRNKGSAWLLLLLVPVAGPLWAAIELGFLRGTPGENRYGPDPLEIRGDYLTVK